MYVGIDVVSANEVSRSLERFGERYVRRIFTPGEAAYCRAATGRSQQRIREDPRPVRGDRDSRWRVLD